MNKNLFFLILIVPYVLQSMEFPQDPEQFYTRLERAQGALENNHVTRFLEKSHQEDIKRLHNIFSHRPPEEKDALIEQSLHCLQTFYPSIISNAGAQLDALSNQRFRYFGQLFKQEFGS